ncbi:hydroxyethylthiazole kinase [Streptococcus dysgalactiae]|uniref:Hydroxyethylthiazole kinase n=1 Tax=Streptococcus dysgalactiae TaxID=1334 RepID=A0AAE9UNW3_STRDY|nr:hydroxyethylthiazole kinase [Streptococcus dysgalactiae]QGH03131.1 hydroxyethylthiazole kinase [Streptococcus dysgalactiae subsp. dysgalactiae]WAI94188.1 hydroxyethylthiazole kinase [Streptococcus dysgalactiae]
MYLEKLRQYNPLTICITNNVVKNMTANGLLAIGASPAMSECLEDLEDLLKIAGALLINIGTLTEDSCSLYQEAIKIAQANHVPVVLDPVAAGASRIRLRVSQKLLTTSSISLLRGNASEIAALVGDEQVSKGADGGQVEDIGAVALKASKMFNIPVVATGEVDAVACDGKVCLLKNGSAMMPLVTGTGCLLGAVLAAFMGVCSVEERLPCLVEAVSLYNIAGEIAEKKSANKGPASFQVAFVDALHQINSDILADYRKTEIYEG